MEEQAELEKEVGTIESESKTLEPKKVKIVKVEIVEVGKNNNKKVNCSVKHPDYDEGTIVISSVNLLIDKKIKSVGLWYNLDKEDNIQKGSALANFLSHVDSKNLKGLEGKEVDTELEERFLCFKGY